MAVTGQQALNLTLAILDEVGSTEYNTRAIYLINELTDELYPDSDTYTVTTAGDRPIVAHITALTDAIALDDVLARSVLPYGLGARLLLIDQPDVASNLDSVYQAKRAMARARMPRGEAVEITDEYDEWSEDEVSY